jgi:hypothetical protein
MLNLIEIPLSLEYPPPPHLINIQLYHYKRTLFLYYLLQQTLRLWESPQPTANATSEFCWYLYDMYLRSLQRHRERTVNEGVVRIRVEFTSEFATDFRNSPQAAWALCDSDSLSNEFSVSYFSEYNWSSENINP